VPKWRVTADERVVEDLRALGRMEARLIFKAAVERLEGDPLAEARNLKTLRPNPVAQRELRLFGVYRVLFNVEESQRLVRISVVGLKRGDSLIVRGERFDAHASDSVE